MFISHTCARSYFIRKRILIFFISNMNQSSKGNTYPTIFCVLFLPSFLLSHAKKPSPAGTKKEKVQRLLLRNRWTSWSSKAGQIRTFSFYPIGNQSVLKTDGLGAILVVERDQHPVIVQKNSIYKNFNQCFPLFFLRNIELSKFHQPESDEILI